jgi:hypothetical protein
MIIFLLYFFLQITFSAWCLDIVVPPDSQHVKNETGYIDGQKIESSTYVCPQSVEDVIKFYNIALAKDGFEPNTEGARRDKPNNMLSFRRGEQVITISAKKDKDGTTKLVTGMFTQSKGSSGLDPNKMNWRDILKMMPKEDMPGADLDVVPRPPKSVRQQSAVRGNVAILSYATKMPIADVAQFYSDNMGQFGWKPQGGGMDYDSLGKDKLSQDFVSVAAGPIPEFEKFLQGSVQLSFISSRGKADVTIMNIDPDDLQSTLVTIYYEEDKSVYAKTSK